MLLTCNNFYEALSSLSNVTHWTIMFVRHELSMTSSDTIRLFPFVIAARSFYHSTRIYLGQRNTPLARTRFLIRIIYYDNVCVYIRAISVAPRVGMSAAYLPVICLLVYL